MGLACRLGVAGHGEDGSTGPVPGEQVCGPADIQTAVNGKEKIFKIISSLLQKWFVLVNAGRIDHFGVSISKS